MRLTLAALVVAFPCFVGCSQWPNPNPVGPTVLSVGPAGGHLVFGNGVVLDVPPGALSQAVAVRATVLTSVPPGSDLPPSAFVTAVQLEPDGLILGAAATLTIPLPPGTPTTNLAGFALDDPTAFPDAGPVGDSMDATDENENADDSGDAVGEDGAVDSGPEDDDESSDPAIEDSVLHEPLAFVNISPTSVQVLADHFSVRLIFLPTTQLLEINSCDFASDDTLGLSNETLQEYLLDNPGSLVSYNAQLYHNLGLTAPAPPWTYLDPAALSDLQMAETQNPYVRPFYGWRSLPTQYVTAKFCHPAAAVGASNHGQGAAIDVNIGLGVPAARKNCNNFKKAHPGATVQQLMDSVVPYGIGETLFANNWVWYGFFWPKTCNDPVHFEHRSTGGIYVPGSSCQGFMPSCATIPSIAVSSAGFPLLENAAGAQSALIAAFQTLYNNNSPCNPIDNDTAPGTCDSSDINCVFNPPNVKPPFGPIDDDTQTALSISPAGDTGFPDGGNIASPVTLPPSGLDGGGCDPTSAATVCCPGSNGSSPTCQASCSCNVPADAGPLTSLTLSSPPLASTWACESNACAAQVQACAADACCNAEWVKALLCISSECIAEDTLAEPSNACILECTLFTLGSSDPSVALYTCVQQANTQPATDLQTDPNNCGTCGNECSSVEICESGHCTCPISGYTVCDLDDGGIACVNTDTDPNHCGACTVTCSGATPFCSGEACTSTPPM